MLSAEPVLMETIDCRLDLQNCNMINRSIRQCGTEISRYPQFFEKKCWKYEYSNKICVIYHHLRDPVEMGGGLIALIRAHIRQWRALGERSIACLAAGHFVWI